MLARLACPPRTSRPYTHLENLTIIQPHQIVEVAKALKAGQV